DQLFDKSLSKIKSKDLEGDQKMAFFINVYNLLTIRAMLHFYPLKSIMDHVSRIGGFHFWKDTYVQFSDQKLSLDQIEHKVLRPMMNAKIHFAIVCASKSCPPLRNEVYTQTKLPQQLDQQASIFFNSPNNFRIDEDKEIVHYSSILSWFKEDFTNNKTTLIESIYPYLNSKHKLFVDQNDMKQFSSSYISYDWAINSKE
ncbi:DUF547 domain-containing protein, partial [bacterium]|nr:DUF547 domain-containing protein [bacterium]